MRKRIWILCCLLAVLLAACGEQPKEPVQPQPPVATEDPEDPEQHVVKAPKKEDQEQPAPDTGYLAELEVHGGQYEGMYHLWVETDQESMKALTPQQYKNYAFGMENKLLPEIGEDGEGQTVYWTTFVFPDGTGICWHGGSHWWGNYGVLDESLRVPEPLYYIGSENDKSDEVSITPWKPAEDSEITN